MRRMTRPNGSRFYQLDYTDALGRRRRKSLGLNKGAAERHAAVLIRDRDRELAGMGPMIGKDREWREVIEDYLGDLALRAKPQYVNRARTNITRVLTGTQTVIMGDITLRGVQMWRQGRAERVASKTVNDDVSKLRTMLTWCVRNGIIAANPLREIGNLRNVQTRPPRALSESEIARLLSACERLDEAAARYHGAERTIASGTKGRDWVERDRTPRVPRSLTLRLLLKMGCRWGEGTALTWADVYPEPRTILLRAETTKTGRPRTFPMDEELEAILAELRAAATRTLDRIPAQGDPVLLSPAGAHWGTDSHNFRLWLYEALGSAGIPRIDEHGRRVHVHALRHTFATRLLRAGVPLQQVMYLGGWRTSRVLEQIYMHLEAEDARGAVASVPLPSADPSAGSIITGTKVALAPEKEAPTMNATDYKPLPAQGLRVAPRVGFEPTTQRLTAACSTN